MAWDYFHSSGSEEITSVLSDTPLKENFVLNDKITVQCNFTIDFQGSALNVNLSADKDIKVFAPNLKAKQGDYNYFLRAKTANGDYCFLNVKGGEVRNGN